MISITFCSYLQINFQLKIRSDHSINHDLCLIFFFLLKFLLTASEVGYYYVCTRMYQLN